MAVRSFRPVVDEKTRVLILGLMPGPESLRRKQYYGHPQNAFCGILGDVIGEKIVEKTHDDRLRALLGHRIGLWDVYASCEREGASDTRIRNASHNAIPRLLASHPSIEKVVFNGTKAGSAARLIEGNVACVIAPSTSPAHTMPYAKKLAAWKRALKAPTNSI